MKFRRLFILLKRFLILLKSLLSGKFSLTSATVDGYTVTV